MARTSGRMRQVVDWGAALRAGIIAGVVFLVVNIVLFSLVVGGNAWVFLRYIGALVLGPGVLAPPATFDPLIIGVGVVVNILLSLIFTLILAVIVHRWGLLTSVVVGAAFGVALYGINIYTLTALFPWFFALNHWTFLIGHVIFGAVAGGVYEALEVERFVPVEEA